MKVAVLSKLQAILAQILKPSRLAKVGQRGNFINGVVMAPTVSGESGSSRVWGTLQSFGEDIADGAIMGDFSDNSSPTKTVSQIGVGLIPVVGQIADGRDTIAAAKKVMEGKPGSWLDLGLAVIGWLPGIGDWIKGAGKTTTILRREGEEVAETVLKRASRGDNFYKPIIEGDYSLPKGEGFTDKFGNVTYSLNGSAKDRALVYHHEMVHSFLSPKFEYLKNFRADLRMDLYQRSSFLRYIEEALAETYAQVRVNGAGAAFEGLRFPITNGYVELKDVVSEAAIGSVVVGGATYGVYVSSNEE